MFVENVEKYSGKADGRMFNVFSIWLHILHDLSAI